MSTLDDLVHHLSPIVFDPEVVAGDRAIGDLCLPAPDGSISPGDLVLGTWVREPAEAANLIRAAGVAHAAAVVIDLPLDDALLATARRSRVGLAGKSVTASWTEVFRAVQAALGAADLGTSRGERVWHELADQGAALLGGPIIIADSTDVVLAHSLDQHEVDALRRDSILNRAIDPAVVQLHRDLGVYDALAAGAEQVMLPKSNHGQRVVLPLTDPAGELVGTVWVVRRSPVPDDELAAAAGWLVMVGQQLDAATEAPGHGPGPTARALRAILHHAPASGPVELGRPPWVVGVIGCAVRSPEVQLTVWHGLFRRRGWRDPLLTTVDAAVACVLQESGDGPGSFAWWTEQLREALADPETSIAVGTRAMSTAELRRSHDDAQELTRTTRLWPELGTTVLRPDEQWPEVSVLRLLEHRADPAGIAQEPVRSLLQQPGYLVETLWAYLQQDASIPRTAEVLTIHPNTLRYRLGKLREVGLDLDRAIVRQALHLRFLGLRAEGRAIIR